MAVTIEYEQNKVDAESTALAAADGDSVIVLYEDGGVHGIVIGTNPAGFTAAYTTDAAMKDHLIDSIFADGDKIDLKAGSDIKATITRENLKGILDSVYEPKILTKNTAFNKDFGTGSDQVSRGDHTHIISVSDITDFPTLPATFAPSNAQKNVQSDWSENSAASDAFIVNKPDLNTYVKVSDLLDAQGKIKSELLPASQNITFDSGDFEVSNGVVKSKDNFTLRNVGIKKNNAFKANVLVSLDNYLSFGISENHEDFILKYHRADSSYPEEISVNHQSRLRLGSDDHIRSNYKSIFISDGEEYQTEIAHGWNNKELEDKGDFLEITIDITGNGRTKRYTLRCDCIKSNNDNGSKKYKLSCVISGLSLSDKTHD